MSKAREVVIELMTKEIQDVEHQTWNGLPDKICSSTLERKQKAQHEENSRSLAERCRQRYLETARNRLRRYENTGTI